MKKPTRLPTLAVCLTALSAALAVFSNSAQAQVTFQSVSNGLVSFYPLDGVITNGAVLTTPDHIGGRDLILSAATTSANLVPANRPVGAPGASSNCFNLNQSGGPTVLFYNSRGQSPLQMTNSTVSDFLPFCNQLDATMSFWIKAASPGTDTRFMGEAANDGNNDPLWLWGDHASAPGRAHLIFRHTVNNGGFTTMSDGTRQNPLAGNYMNQDSAYTTNTLLDSTWHLFTVVIDTNGFVDVYVDGTRDIGGVQNGLNGYTNALGEAAVCKPMFVTNTYYTTNLYPKVTPPSSNPPPRGYVKWVMNSMFTGGSTAFGGFKRGASPSAGINCQIDDIAFWNRALNSNEIAFVYTNGLPGISLTRPLVINNFAASVVEVAKGDVATLAWNVTGASTTPGSITISGVGDVTATGAIGAVNVPMNGGDQLFTLIATNATGSATNSINVKVFPGVDSNWHLFQRFDGLYADTENGIATDIFGNRNWNSAISSFAGAFDRWNVVTVTNSGAENKVLSPRTGYVPNATSAIGFDSRGALAYAGLNSLTVSPNQTRTLFFRFSLQDPQSWVQSFGVYSDMDAHIGLTDYNWWAGPEGAGPAPAELFTRGPMVNIVRATATGYTTQEPFNLRAYDWSGTGTTNTYSYVASVDAAGLQTNANYMLWMDIENHSTGYDTSTSSTTNMPLYSVYLQKQGDPTRTLLFSGFHGNRNFAPPTDLGPNQATPFLDKFFANMGTESILTSVPGAYFETNMIAIDDIYISKSGVNSSVPRLFDITSIVKGASSVTLTWDSLGSLFGTNTYTIQRKTALADSTWTTLGTVPSGGSTTTYVDNTVGSSSSAYYRIVWP